MNPLIKSPRYSGVLLLTPLALAVSSAVAAPLPGGTLDPLTIPKYVTPLVIPPVMNNTGTANDYDIAVRQFKQQILPGGIWNTINKRTDSFPATTVWSYGPATDPTPAIAPDPVSQFNYPAYTIEASTNLGNLPANYTTVDWINELVVNPDDCFNAGGPTNQASCNYLPHLLPVDRSLHWANPEQLTCIDRNKKTDCAPDPVVNGASLKEPYLGPVPMVVHVHGAHSEAASDGYAEAWWLPSANNIDCTNSPAYPATPDSADDYACNGTMVNQFGITTNDPARPGVGSFSYRNDQPSATIWYHDHSLGMTRSNVYAGPAGFWILRDPDAPAGETGLAMSDSNPQVLPGPAPVAGDTVVELNVPSLDPNGNNKRSLVREIPVVIQDRSFNSDGSLFYPDNRAFFEGLTIPKLQIPFLGDLDTSTGTSLSDIAAIWNPEAFFNTMVVNGVSWPSLEVEPDLYRFRLLNGCNSRFLNLALYVVNVDGTLGEAIPFYQIGAEQSLLPKVVKIVRGDRAVLPGDGSNPALTATPLPVFPSLRDDLPAEETVAGLLMGNAERADVLVDFSNLAPGTRVRMINTGPDDPFGGFPLPPADPDTSGQVMEFTVGADTAAGEGFTAPESLVLSPVDGVDTYPVGMPNLNPTPRDQALLEEESLLVCATTDLQSNIVWDPTAVPGTGELLGTCQHSNGETARSLPFAPKAAVLGINGKSGGIVTLWSDPIETNPLYAANTPPTETWEFWNWTVDGHPVHVHEVKFKVLNREAFDPLSGTLSGTVNPPEATEAGWKDTVIAYPGEVTRIAATFDIQGLYVWHCHIVEHEDNEMMVPYCVGDKATAPGCDVAPVAGDDTYSTEEDILTVAAPGVLQNDSDVNNGDALTAILVADPANGTVTLNSDGSFTYTPTAGFRGTDSFTYQASDGSLLSNVAKVTVTVGTQVNAPPVAANDAYSTAQGTTLNVPAPGVLANDSDPEGSALTAALASGTTNGSLTLSPDGSFSYTPNETFSGTDSLTYQASDGSLTSNVATVTITVSPTAAVQLYLSLRNAAGTLVGLGPNGTNLAYANEDILSWNGVNYAMVFDGSAAGLPASTNVTGFKIDAVGNRILMAFGVSTSVPGVGTVTGSDIVAYDRAGGAFSLFFDGSDVGLTTRLEALNTVQLLANGHLILSTTGLALVPSGTILPIVARAQDLLEFTPTSLGPTTSGTWRFYFDGSDVGLTSVINEDLDGASVAGSGDIYLTTTGNFSVPGLSGQDEDVFRCTPSSLGNKTACTFAPFFDGTAHGLGPDDVDGIDLP